MQEYFLKTTVCIVGTGFCGYAAYEKLKSKDINLIVVEGGKKETPKSANEQPFFKVSTNKYFLNKKNNFNIINKIDPSFRDRRFTLGGSSEAWSGWIKPFEKTTFQNYFDGNENQSWGDLSLKSYEKEVLKLLNSPIENFDIKNLNNKLNLNLPKLPQGFDYTAFAFAKKKVTLKSYWINKINKNFDFSKSNNKELILGYRLIDFSKKSDQIYSLKFLNESNNSILYVEADYFMLCMGGIENSKFVSKIIKDLDLKKSISNYVGNFQEHPHLYNIASFNKGENELPNILIKYKLISDNLDSSFNEGSVKFSISAWDGIGTPKVTFTIRENKENAIINGLKNFLKSQIEKNIVPKADYIITMRCEQTINKNSKLEFESNKTNLDWQINDEDLQIYSDYLRRISSFLISNKFAKDFLLTYPSQNNLAIPKMIYGGAHHMSTVPYLKNELLVNKKFQLSMLKNTYVVGSSAFPVSGFENPTHAAMAISLLASEDIIEKITK